MSVWLHASIPRLLHKPGYVFSGIDVFTALLASTEPRRSLLDIGVELVPVVECGHHDVPALAPIRVVAVVPNDPATAAVVVRIHPSHDCSIRVEGDRTLVRGCGWRADNGSWGQNWCRSDRIPVRQLRRARRSALTRRTCPITTARRSAAADKAV